MSSAAENIVGLDIGGANLKAADIDGRAVARPFAVWREPENLARELLSILREFPAPRTVAVTMTAELADCFATKAEGVQHVLTSVQTALRELPSSPASATNQPPELCVWQTGAEFVPAEIAVEIPLLAAAANWHALATWVGRLAPAGTALLIDIGTTTTDLIPLQSGVPIPQGLTDPERLLSGELVYTGVRRTPLCAVAPALPLRDRLCPVAAELFATTLDVYLLLGELPEAADDCDTANGRPATIAAAHDRLVRMLCCDRTEIPLAEARDIARYLADQQRRQIAQAIDKILARLESPPQQVLLSGAGVFIAERIVQTHPILGGAAVSRLDAMFDPQLATAACAYAVARLAAERI